MRIEIDTNKKSDLEKGLIVMQALNGEVEIEIGPKQQVQELPELPKQFQNPITSTHDYEAYKKFVEEKLKAEQEIPKKKGFFSRK